MHQNLYAMNLPSPASCAAALELLRRPSHTAHAGLAAGLLRHRTGALCMRDRSLGKAAPTRHLLDLIVHKQDLSLG